MLGEAQTLVALTLPAEARQSQPGRRIGRRRQRQSADAKNAAPGVHILEHAPETALPCANYMLTALQQHHALRRGGGRSFLALVIARGGGGERRLLKLPLHRL